jgi:hypothetical protein
MCSKQNGARAETQAEAEDLIDEIKSGMTPNLRARLCSRHLPTQVACTR